MRLVDAFVRRPAAAVGWLLSSLGLTSTRTKGGALRAKNNKGKCNPDDEVTRAEKVREVVLKRVGGGQHEREAQREAEAGAVGALEQSMDDWVGAVG